MKRCLLVLLLAGSVHAVTAPSTLIANVPGRTTVSLDGAWRAIVDPFENGKSSGFFRNEKPRSKSDRVEYSFDASPVLNVPGDWNTQREQLMFYEGPVWYRREFAYHTRANTRVFVYFGAANYQTTVYLNGEKLGEHEGGFTAFNFEATSVLRDGDNFLIVEVNNTRRADAVPALKFDWWNYGGITRDVMLVEVPGTFIQDYSVQLERGSQSEISGWVQDRMAAPIATEGHTGDPRSWGPRNFQCRQMQTARAFVSPPNSNCGLRHIPSSTTSIISSGDDTVHDQIGFRTIEVKGAKILLNGEPIFLRGISMHEEAPFREGRAFSLEDAQTLLGWVKDLGCNFVRFAHYPHNENEIRLADRMGLMVWSEIPVYWDIDWSNPRDPGERRGATARHDCARS